MATKTILNTKDGIVVPTKQTAITNPGKISGAIKDGTKPGYTATQGTGTLVNTTISAAEDPLKDQKLVPGTFVSGGGSGRRVSYIGNNGSKNTGLVTPTPGQTPDYYNQLGKLNETIYKDRTAANDAALEATRQRAQEETDALIAALADEYAGTNRALYRDYMNSRRTLPQQLAAMGYNGGLSESSLLRLNNSYEEGLNENERARLAQETAYNQALAQQLFEAQQKATEANNQARQNWYGQQATLKDMIYKDAQQRAATMHGMP